MRTNGHAGADEVASVRAGVIGEALIDVLPARAGAPGGSPLVRRRGARPARPRSSSRPTSASASTARWWPRVGRRARVLVGELSAAGRDVGGPCDARRRGPRVRSSSLRWQPPAPPTEGLDLLHRVDRRHPRLGRRGRDHAAPGAAAGTLVSFDPNAQPGASWASAKAVVRRVEGSRRPTSSSSATRTPSGSTLGSSPRRCSTVSSGWVLLLRVVTRGPDVPRPHPDDDARAARDAGRRGRHDRGRGCLHVGPAARRRGDRVVGAAARRRAVRPRDGAADGPRQRADHRVAAGCQPALARGARRR